MPVGIKTILSKFEDVMRDGMEVEDILRGLELARVTRALGVSYHEIQPWLELCVVAKRLSLEELKRVIEFAVFLKEWDDGAGADVSCIDAMVATVSEIVNIGDMAITSETDDDVAVLTEVVADDVAINGEVAANEIAVFDNMAMSDGATADNVVSEDIADDMADSDEDTELDVAVLLDGDLGVATFDEELAITLNEVVDEVVADEVAHGEIVTLDEAVASKDEVKTIADEAKAKLSELIKEGHTAGEIARVLGRTPQWVGRVVSNVAANKPMGDIVAQTILTKDWDKVFGGGTSDDDSSSVVEIFEPKEGF